VIPSIARSGNFSATVENELNRKVNVGTFGVACNLDSICQGAQGPMCPTRATILRQVLVEGMGQIRNSVHVSPSKGVRQRSSGNVGMRQWELVMIQHWFVGSL